MIKILPMLSAAALLGGATAALAQAPQAGQPIGATHQQADTQVAQLFDRAGDEVDHMFLAPG